MMTPRDRVLVGFEVGVGLLALVALWLGHDRMAEPWALTTVLLGAGAVEVLLAVVPPRGQRPRRAVRLVLLVAATLLATRMGDLVHTPLWIVCALPAAVAARMWRGGVAALVGLALFGSVFVSAALLPPDHAAPVDTRDAARLALQLGVVWAGVLLLDLLLDVIRRHADTRRAELAGATRRHVRLEAILRAIDTAVLVVDPHGWIRRANRAAEQLIGRTSPQLEGVLVDAVVHIGWAAPGEPRPERSGRSEIPVRGGEPIPVGYRIAKLETDGDSLVLVHDLRAHYAALSDIEARSEALETAGRAQTRFLATVGHQLRTPMDALLDEASLLAETEPLSQRQQRYIGIARRNAEQLLRLVDDMLLLARVEAGLLPPEQDEITVMRLLREGGIPRSPMLEAIAGDEGMPTVGVDRQWMDRVFQELVDPTPFVGGPPLQAEHYLAGDRYLLWLPSHRLTDDDDPEFVFGPHFPEHEGRSAFASARLGLMLARALVRAQRGELRLGRDSTGRPCFVVELPHSGARPY